MKTIEIKIDGAIAEVITDDAFATKKTISAVIVDAVTQWNKYEGILFREDYQPPKLSRHDITLKVLVADALYDRLRENAENNGVTPANIIEDILIYAYVDLYMPQ